MKIHLKNGYENLDFIFRKRERLGPWEQIIANDIQVVFLQNVM